MIHPPFVQEEDNVHQVLSKIARAHVININDAPGFGKSTLAIHVGYELVKNEISVLYINNKFTMASQWQRSNWKVRHEFSSNTACT